MLGGGFCRRGAEAGTGFAGGFFDEGFAGGDFEFGGFAVNFGEEDVVESVSADFEGGGEIAEMAAGHDAGGGGAGDVEGTGEAVFGEELGDFEIEGVAVVPACGEQGGI